jgi:hypothetical protein
VSQVLQEFLDDNMHRSYPLEDDSTGIDVTGALTLPSPLITDIFLCVPNLPNIDKTKFYISNIIIRAFFIDITLSYDDPAVVDPIGVFKQISTTAELQATYDFIPSELQTGNEYTALFHMTGQIVIGAAEEATKFLGSWNFLPAETAIVSTRISKGLLNVQYISVNDNLFTGNVRFREGNNVSLDTTTTTILGVPHTVITVSASLNAGSSLQIANDEDLLTALINKFGVPIQSINGMLPDVNRNFNVFGLDCSAVSNITNGITLGNPCATPCCDQDANLTSILESITNLNSRYGQLKGFYDATSSSINDLQNRLLALGTTI